MTRMLQVLAVTLVVTVAGCVPDPETPAAIDTPAAPTAPDTVRVLAYNIHHGAGMDDVIDLERIADIIRDVNPDLVALQEVDSIVTRTGHVDQIALLGQLTGMTPVFGGFMPYQGGTYGMALLSAWPVSDVTNFRLPDGEEPRTALSLVATSPRSGRQLRLVGIHFYETQEERLAQARSLNDYLATDSLPTVLAGDFNSEPGGAVMDYLAETWHIVPKGEDHLTFSSFEPEKEIDFMLLRPLDRFRVACQYLLDEPVASDHRPLVIDLVLSPRNLP